jgi:hypothetical protein
MYVLGQLSGWDLPFHPVGSATPKPIHHPRVVVTNNRPHGFTRGPFLDRGPLTYWEAVGHVFFLFSFGFFSGLRFSFGFSSYFDFFSVFYF